MKFSSRNIICVVAIYLTAMPVSAQTVCVTRDTATRNLDSKYNENLVFAGIAAGPNKTNVLIEVFVSPAGTFSILVNRPDGISCMLAAGENWTALGQKPPKT